jgi:hypothetical protein
MTRSFVNASAALGNVTARTPLAKLAAFLLVAIEALRHPEGAMQGDVAPLGDVACARHRPAPSSRLLTQALLQTSMSISTA